MLQEVEVEVDQLIEEELKEGEGFSFRGGDNESDQENEITFRKQDIHEEANLISSD